VDELPTATLPKSELPPLDSPVPAGCSTTIAGVVPVPPSTILKGFCTGSLLAKWRFALRVPAAPGANRATKLVVPPGTTGWTGPAVIEKSDAELPSMVMASPVKFAPPTFLIVNVRVVELPIAIDPKSAVAPFSNGVPAGCSTTRVGTIAVPVRFTLKGLFKGSLLVMCSAAYLVPAVGGVNWTLIDEFPPGVITVEVRGVETVKAAASGPSMDTLKPVRFAVPVLRIENVRVDELPTATLPKSELPPLDSPVPAGCSTTIAGVVPVPPSTILNGLFSGSLLQMCNVAFRGPGADGVNRTVNKALPPGPTVDAGGLCTESMAASGPSISKVTPVRLAFPLLVIEKVRLTELPNGTTPKEATAPLAKAEPGGCWTAIKGAGVVPASWM